MNLEFDPQVVEGNGHPKGLYVLFATELWERFSYYALKAIFFCNSIYGGIYTSCQKTKKIDEALKKLIDKHISSQCRNFISRQYAFTLEFQSPRQTLIEYIQLVDARLNG